MFTLDNVDGEAGTVSAAFLDEIDESARDTVTRMEAYGVGSRAAQARRIRNCLWKDQHFSERQWNNKTTGFSAFPFNGASDIRVRLADYLVNERVSECFVALMRAQPGFGSVDGEASTAAFLAKIWKDLKQRVIQLEWVVQNLLLANYLYGGGRGVAGMWTGWDYRKELRPAMITLEEVQGMYMAQRPLEQEMAARDWESITALAVEGGIDGLQELMLIYQFAKSRGAAKAAAEELRANKTARIVRVEVVKNQPKMRALALGDELWIDPTTPVADGDAADGMHITEWMSKAGIRAKAAAEGWSKEFVKEVLEQGDGSQNVIFPVYELSDGDDDKVNRVESQMQRESYQIAHSYIRAVDKDGIEGRYEVIWSPGIKRAARGLKLVREAHGGWPVQIFCSEVIGPFALDSRGLPLLAAGIQSHMKISHDMIANVSMLQLPPITTKGRLDQGDLMLEPLGEVPLGITGEAKFMTTPQVPQTTLIYLKELRLMRDTFFGLENPDIPVEMWQNPKAMRVFLFLAQICELMRRMISITVARLPREAVAEYPSLASGAFSFPLQLRCDVREWSQAYVKDVAEVFNNLLMPMDRKGAMDLAPAVQSFVMDLMPEHAELINRDPERAAADQIKDEQDNYLLIRAGIRPPVPEGGNWDYQGRLAMYQEMQQANPAVFADMPPDKQQLMQEHMQALQMQVMQQDNAATGRSGVKEKVGAISAQ